MKFSDRVKYKYLQKNYGRRKYKKKKDYNILRTLDEMEEYIERKFNKYLK